MKLGNIIEMLESTKCHVGDVDCRIDRDGDSYSLTYTTTVPVKYYKDEEKEVTDDISQLGVGCYFIHDDNIYRVVESNHRRCELCAFDDRDCMKMKIPECGMRKRVDKLNVHFKLLPNS